MKASSVVSSVEIVCVCVCVCFVPAPNRSAVILNASATGDANIAERLPLASLVVLWLTSPKAKIFDYEVFYDTFLHL
jgi:hypothetical protein